jgi:hypothetical protein
VTPKDGLRVACCPMVGQSRSAWALLGHTPSSIPIPNGEGVTQRFQNRLCVVTEPDDKGSYETHRLHLSVAACPSRSPSRGISSSTGVR